MKRRDFLRNVGLGAATLAVPRLASAAPARRLNFVFILMDDMGQHDAGCYGSTFYETPNIDRLAADGMRFTSAYAACPVCSPTRASIMTGRYPARVGVTNFIGGERKGKLNPAPYRHELPLEEVTLAEALRDGGYTTGFMGKWHLGGPGFFPDNQGFDTNIAGCGRGSPPGYFGPFEGKRAMPNLPGGPQGEYLTDRLTDEAVKFLGAHRERPFLLYLSHYAVHVPLQAKQALIEHYRAKAAGLVPAGPRFLPEGAWQARQVQDHAVYAAMVQSADESVGRVRQALADLGLAEDTAVIFMSDNGGLSTAEGSPTANVPLRGGKGWLYEGGIREPMIVRWPGVTRPGSVCDEPVISNDFYPTMLEMAGLPARPRQHVDGVSIAPLLRGRAKLPPRDLFWHYPHYSNQGGGPGGAVRSGDQKLIEWYEDNRAELYNLRDDLGEKNDLAGKNPAKVAELREKLHRWRESVGAAMPTPNPDWKG